MYNNIPYLAFQIFTKPNMLRTNTPSVLFMALVLGQVTGFLAGQSPAYPDSQKSLFEAIENQTQWPSYRGFLASGTMNNAGLPDSFNVETGYHIRWNTEIPGMGLSCPVVWGDRIYVTSAFSQEDKAGLATGIYGDIAPVNDTSEH